MEKSGELQSNLHDGLAIKLSGSFSLQSNLHAGLETEVLARCSRPFSTCCSPSRARKPIRNALTSEGAAFPKNGRCPAARQMDKAAA